ncbi:NIF3-like protein 1 [Tribolium madens]|uniref:NIF3-like protein 1 n=1 Tax=Tribolium madens TaxID=41895 RepID=UPI001CF73C99|nr:NIF3-like protein 1 [Tribolium madens]
MLIRRLVGLNRIKNYTTGPQMSVKDIVKTLQSFAPLNLAENWDNVGLLVDPMTDKHVKTILLTNDLTEDVVNEAKNFQAGLIISYHPNIFQGLKTVSDKTWKERIVIQCIKHEIAVFSPHTTWDCIEGGVNDWLASAFDYKSIEPIKPLENPRQGAGRILTLATPITLENAVTNVKKHVGVRNLRLALARNKTLYSKIETVGLCAGSGASVLRGLNADLYLTGEMSHHEVLDATQNGVHVILTEHSNSERGFLGRFQRHLIDIFQNSVNVIVSSVDRDPLIVV